MEKTFLEKILFSTPIAVIILIIGLFAFFGYKAKSIEKDNSYRNILPPDDQALIMNDFLKDNYNITEKTVIAIKTNDSIYNIETLQKVQNITNELENISEITDIKSLYTIENITSDGSELNIYPVLQSAPQTKKELEDLRISILKNNMINRIIVSPDETTTIIAFQPDFDLSDTDTAMIVNSKLEKIIEKYKNPEKIYTAGFPITVPTVSSMMSKDLQTLLRRVFLLISIILLLIFRRIKEIALPVIEVALCTVVVFGLMVIFNVKLTILSTSIPVLLIAIGVADDIHFLSAFNKNYNGSKIDAVIKTFRELKLPIFLTSITTSLGFLSLYFTNIIALKMVGIFTAVGIMITFVFSLIFVPNILLLLPAPKIKTKSKTKNKSKDVFILLKPFVAVIKYFRLDQFIRIFQIKNIIKFIQHFSLQRPYLVVLLCIILTVLGVVFSFKIPVRHSAVEFFRKNSTIRVHHDIINEIAGGTATINVIFKGSDNTFKDHEILKKIEGFQKHISQLDYIGYSISAPDFIKRLNYVMNSNDINFEKIPENNNLIAQYLLLYESSGGNEISKYINQNYSEAIVSFQIKKNDTVTFQELVKHINSYFQDNFTGTKIELKNAGFVMVNLSTVDKIVKGQFLTVGIVFILILLILLIFFRSFNVTLIGSTPIIMTLALIPVVMFRRGIPLNLSTSIIGGVVISIAIDYCIHFISNYYYCLKDLKDNEMSLYEAIKNTSLPIIANSLAVGIGFVTLVSSGFTPNIYLGFLLFVTMLFSGPGAIIILSAFFKYFPLKVRRVKNAS